MTTMAPAQPVHHINLPRLNDALDDLDAGEFDLDVRAAIVAVTSSITTRPVPNAPTLTQEQARSISAALNSLEGSSYQRINAIRALITDLAAQR